MYIYFWYRVFVYRYVIVDIINIYFYYCSFVYRVLVIKVVLYINYIIFKMGLFIFIVLIDL